MVTPHHTPPSFPPLPPQIGRWFDSTFRQFVISLIIEFGPLIIFFASDVMTGDFFFAVKAFLLSVVIALSVSLGYHARIPTFSLIASCFVLISGGLTLLTHNPYWVVLEYTLYNALFALGMLVGYLRDRPALEHLFGTMFHITKKGWHIISARWGIAFFCMAFANEWVYRMYGEEGWIHYRLYAGIAVALFAFFQLSVSKRERMPEATEWGLRKKL